MLLVLPDGGTITRWDEGLFQKGKRQMRIKRKEIDELYKVKLTDLDKIDYFLSYR